MAFGGGAQHPDAGPVAADPDDAHRQLAVVLDVQVHGLFGRAWSGPAVGVVQRHRGGQAEVGLVQPGHDAARCPGAGRREQGENGRDTDPPEAEHGLSPDPPAGRIELLPHLVTHQLRHDASPNGSSM